MADYGVTDDGQRFPLRLRARGGSPPQLKLVLDTVPRQLGHEPTVPTRNRRPLETNPIAPWELRIGHLALTPIMKSDWESIAVAGNPRFLEIIERSRKSLKPGLSTEEMRRRLGLRRRTG